MSLTILQPPEVPLVSLEETKAYLRLEGNAEDALILRLIAASTESLEAITGQSFLQKTYQYTAPLELFGSEQEGGSHIFATSVVRIPLPRPPIQRVLSVVLKAGLQEQEIPAERHSVIAHHGPAQLTVCLPPLSPCKAPYALVVSFLAGFGETARSVPEALCLATLMLAADAYEKRDGFSAKAGLPQGVLALIQPYRLLNML
ncbi:MAG: head-tail connector protein [Holosporales bacterium]|jgi:uncharacterized phiE125 gp8 family phage protein|nr:head-tail connector protein [Holosporales bacterium]